MPKKLQGDKRGRRSMSSKTARNRLPAHSVKDLLTRNSPTLQRVTAQRTRQNIWEKWLQEQLPGELHEQLSGVSEQHGVLTVFAVSAAWSARLRFALAELEARARELAPQLERIEVKVLPRR
jgi:hypothetical protein